MKRADDVGNLFRSFGASTDSYLEIEGDFDYKEKPSAVRPSDIRAVSPDLTPGEPQSSTLPSLQAQSLASEPDHAETIQPRPASTPLQNLLREVARAREAEAAARNQQALLQSLGKEPLKPLKAQVVAVVSPKGGVGKTTLSAGLATVLRLQGGQTLAIDLDPQSALQYHLQVSPDVAGMGNASLLGENWRSLLLPGSAGTQLLPYGILNEEERRTLERFLDSDPQWLARQLARMDLGERDVVVIDTPPGRTAYLEQVLTVADHILVVATADAASYQTLDQMERLLSTSRPRSTPFTCSYVINQFDASRAFSRDMLVVLERRLGRQLLGVVNVDHDISEALAYGRNPLEGACASEGCKDMLALGRAMTAQLMTQKAKESYIS
ncbi:cell division protein FtsQ [Pseudomonas sp. S25]|uniref:Cell division protein FtsQ n=1 Tax=Pseudomonas maioricensis TaxID=1766623 RepID=A0ABS9ZKV7_9PSED|nr:cellulose biosynthesis protein BcsQ [Pseudomonas sp. S25]MCI8210877.1 cell division protein FtsQ [Pseudomonas sp. S25]